MRELVTVCGQLDGSAHHSDDDATISVVLSGSAETAALDNLDLFLTRVHAESVRLHVREVVVDMTKLEFMNSSCFRIVLTWITDIEDLEPAARYRVKVLSDSKLHWQNRSLHSLRSFAVDTVSVVKV
ncbi:MAG TPA: hypothetical protein VIU61_05900 [Kofleriaceae bacterium]